MSSMIELDGAHGEGGGQILRTSLTLSLLTGKPFHLANVRAGRQKPGLQPQHLMSVKAAAAVGGASVRGASVGSSDLVFEPGEVRAGTYTFDIGTAGATGLVLHTIYLPLALRGQAASEVLLVGGTHVRTSPSFHFNAWTWREHVARLGLPITLEMRRPGFYPRGGGRLRALIPAVGGLTAASLGSRTESKTVHALAAVAGLDAGIARRMARRARHRLEQLGLEVETTEEEWDGGPGCVLVLRHDVEPVPVTVSVPGERGKPAEAVADEACEELARYVHRGPAAVDEHSADQIVLPLALAEGAAEYDVVTVTRHLTTNVGVIRRFLDREIVIEGAEGEPGKVKVGRQPGV